MLNNDKIAGDSKDVRKIKDIRDGRNIGKMGETGYKEDVKEIGHKEYADNA